MAILLIALSVVAVAAECTEAEAKAFEKWDHDWSKYNAEGNRAELEKIYADDFVGIGGLSLGTDSKKTIIDNAVKNAGSNPNRKSTSHNYLITCTPSTVTIVHRNTVVVTTDGKESTSWSRTAHVLEKRGGNWRVVSSFSNGVDGDRGAIFSITLDGDQASMNRDLDWLRKNVADDFVGIIGDGVAYDKPQMIAYLENLWKTDKSKVKTNLSDITIRVDGDMGIITGVRHSKGIDNDGKPVDSKARFSRTLVKRDGKWMRIAATDVGIKAE